MTAAFVIVVTLALVPQVYFTVSYWRRIPSWYKNPYGRMAQLGSWCHIILLSLYLVLVLFGKSLNRTFTGVILISAFVPLIFYGILQLNLLKRAIESSKMLEEKEAVSNDN